MIVIGLTGGIASGKSTVSAMLAEKGAAVIDADKLGHDVLRSDAEAREEIVKAYGTGVLAEHGQISRQKLGEIVFNDLEALQKLNSIMHPRIHRLVEQQLDRLRQNRVEVAVVEAALFIEGGWNALVDEVWATYVPAEVALLRLMERNGVSEKDAQVRMSSQMSPEEKAKRADVVINTSGSLSDVRKQVEERWAELMARFEREVP